LHHNIYFLEEPKIPVPPRGAQRTTTATQVSMLSGIAKDGNKVFSAQIVAHGPMIKRKITNSAIRRYFILNPY